MTAAKRITLSLWVGIFAAIVACCCVGNYRLAYDLTAPWSMSGMFAAMVLCAPKHNDDDEVKP